MTAYLWLCTPSEDSNQLAHSRSPIRTFTGCIMDSQGCKFAICRTNEDSNQSTWMRRLIEVFFWRTCQKVSVLTLRLIFYRVNLIEQSALQDLKEKIIASRTELMNEFKKFDTTDCGNIRVYQKRPYGINDRCRPRTASASAQSEQS